MDKKSKNKKFITLVSSSLLLSAAISSFTLTSCSSQSTNTNTALDDFETSVHKEKIQSEINRINKQSFSFTKTSFTNSEIEDIKKNPNSLLNKLNGFNIENNFTYSVINLNIDKLYASETKNQNIQFSFQIQVQVDNAKKASNVIKIKSILTDSNSSQSTEITQESLTIANKSNYLPSQLIDVSNSEINENMLTRNFDSTKITDVQYKLDSLDDLKGTLSINMQYKFNNKNYNYIFNFSGLKTLSKTSNYYLYLKPNAKIISALSAYDVSQKNVDNNTKFQDLISELSKNGNELELSTSKGPIPISYLEVSNCSISGFNDKWFLEPKKILLTFTLSGPKVIYYQKRVNSNLLKHSFEYTSSNSKKFEINFCSAADYLLNKITTNTSYSTNEYAQYYYGDILANNGIQSSIQLSNNAWLANCETSMTTKTNNYNKTYTYQPVLVNGIANVEEGNLIINLKMRILTDNSNDKQSSTQKKLKITGFKKINSLDLFNYSNNDELDKFSFSQDHSKLEENLQKLKICRKNILSKIDSSSDNEVLLSEVVNNNITSNIVNSTKSYFSGEELIKDTDKKNWYSNNFIYVQLINFSDFQLFYNKEKDVFQVKTNVSLEMEQTYETKSPITINITTPGNSKSKLENL